MKVGIIDDVLTEQRHLGYQLMRVPVVEPPSHAATPRLHRPTRLETPRPISEFAPVALGGGGQSGAEEGRKKPPAIALLVVHDR